MEDNDQTFFVTEDACLITPGILDETDIAAMPPNAICINSRQASARMRAAEKQGDTEIDLAAMNAVRGELTTINVASTPTPEGFTHLTPEDMDELRPQAAARQLLFQLVASELVDETLARAIRRMRVEERRTWRSVAREASKGHQLWEPPSNQVMGMALCEKAARFFREDYMSPPWN